MERKRVVARNKQDGSYACEGYETGMGKTIERTTNIAKAKMVRSPAGIMAWMGGHYTSYDPVEVIVRYEKGRVLSYPPENQVWD